MTKEEKERVELIEAGHRLIDIFSSGMPEESHFNSFVTHDNSSALDGFNNRVIPANGINVIPLGLWKEIDGSEERTIMLYSDTRHAFCIAKEARFLVDPLNDSYIHEVYPLS